MRLLAYVTGAIIVMTLAFWAYRENYRTQDSLNRMQAVQMEIARLREELGILRAEWAYLNRPARLQELVTLNAEALSLAPIAPGQFVEIRQIPYPPPPIRTPPRRPADFVPPDMGQITEDDPTPAETAEVEPNR